MALYWNSIDWPAFGLANRISDFIRLEEWRSPNLLCSVRRASELVLASDYGGSHQTSLYQTYAFLLIDTQSTETWEIQRQRVRGRLLPDGRRISYKDLKDRKRAQSLVPLLRAANTLRGLLVVFAIHKGVPSLLGEAGNRATFVSLPFEPEGWKAKGYERLCLIGHLGALLVAGLSAPKQNIVWITDQDDLAANSKRHEIAGNVLLFLLSHYAPKNHGTFLFVTTEADGPDRRFEDLVALTDLAAGSIAEIMSFTPDLSDLVLKPLSNQVTDKARAILGWLSGITYPLRRLIIALDPQENDISVRRLHLFTDSHIPEYDPW